MHSDANHQVREEIFTCVSDYLCGNFDLYVLDVTVIALTCMFQSISVETLTYMFQA